MILAISGAGLIGLNIGTRFVEMGERVVLTQCHAQRDPGAFKFQGGGLALVESLDVTDAADVWEVRKRHRITDVIHLAAPPARLEKPEGNRAIMVSHMACDHW